jgi:nitrogen regulatory protein P-II 2
VAIIKPFKFDAVRDSLTKIGIDGMTATEVTASARRRGAL